ncbi:MAG: universal stress protein [Pirellulaceae bacterium]|nr:universal stress protein [Pirellulaceae bacterium]
MSGLHPKLIVVPVDFSEMAFDALDQAVQIAGDEGDVRVIHVLATLPTMEPGNLYGTVTDETRMESVQKSLSDRFAKKKYDRVKSSVSIGDPGREIVAFADNESADLIVIPSHGYGFFRHMLLGSVAERVVRLATCPVLVLRSAPVDGDSKPSAK